MFEMLYDTNNEMLLSVDITGACCRRRRYVYSNFVVISIAVGPPRKAIAHAESTASDSLAPILQLYLLKKHGRMDSGGHVTQRNVVHMALEEIFLEGPDLMALGCSSKGYNWVSHACSNYVRCCQTLRRKKGKLEEGNSVST